jgi:hypothetical protein
MARGRLVSKSLGSSRKFHALLGAGGKLGEFCQILFPLIIANTDDFGRMSGDAFTIKNVVLPSSRRPERDFDRALNILADTGLIQRYQVDGAIYLHVEQFDAHQANLHKRTASKFPEFPGKSGIYRSNLTEFKGTELKGSEEKRTESNQYSGEAPRVADENLRIITKIAHEAMDLTNVSAEWGETVKSLCAQRKIAYDSPTVQKAIESAIHQRKFKAVAS